MHYLSGLKDWNGKIDFNFHPFPDHAIKFGAGNIYHEFNTGAIQVKGSYGGSTERSRTGRKPLYAHEMSAYVEDDWRVSTRLKANIGLHYAGFLVNNKYYQIFSAENLIPVYA